MSKPLRYEPLLETAAFVSRSVVSGGALSAWIARIGHTDAPPAAACGRPPPHANVTTDIHDPSANVSTCLMTAANA